MNFRAITWTLIYLLSCLVFVGVSAPGFAQSAGDAAAEEINRILNLEEERRQQELRELRERQRTHTVIPSKKPPELELPIADQQTCFDIAEIVVKGAFLLDPQEVERVKTVHLGKCLGIVEINQIVSALTSLYIDKGYITSRAYIPPQNLRTGTLTIEVVEGFVEAIRVEGGPQRLAATAWPGVVGAPLNLRRIEQGLDQINRLAASQARVDFLPGKKVGGTVIVVNYVKDSLISATLGRNNSGQSATGEQQIAGSLEVHSLFGVNDHLYLTLQADTKDDYQGMKSESAGVNYTVPYGYWTFSLGYNQFTYMNTIQGSNTVFTSEGTSQSERFNIRRMLFRDQNQKISLSGLVKHQATDNFIEDVKLDTSSVDYMAAELALEYEHYFSGGKTLIGSMGYTQGLSGNGSEAQKSIYTEDFQKINMDVTYSDSVQWLAGTWRWSTGVHGQHSNGVLYSAESFSIGSQYTVRGFKEDGLSDSGGAYWRNELSTTYFPVEHNPRFYVTPYMAADAGVIDSGDSLSGWAAGLRTGGKFFRAEVAYSRPISAPETIDRSASTINFSFMLFASW